RRTLVRYDSQDVTQSDRQMQGQLSENPLAELIREINDTGLSGALRVSHDRAKVVVYFETGDLLFAASNLRAHRLRELLKRSGIADDVRTQAANGRDQWQRANHSRLARARQRTNRHPSKATRLSVPPTLAPSATFAARRALSPHS